MRRILKRRGGFTLIELMIVVAIIGILAAIAIPNFMQFQMRATSSEGKTNLAAIRTAEEGYFAEFRTYVTAAAAGNTANGTTKVAWSPAATNGFNTIGWAPEGDVYFQYQVTAGMANTTTGFDEFAAGAQANLDGADNNGDGIATQQWAYLKPVAGNTATAMAPPYNGAGCAAAGVWDPVAMSTNLLRTVGPCDMSSGQSEF